MTKVWYRRSPRMKRTWINFAFAIYRLFFFFFSYLIQSGEGGTGEGERGGNIQAFYSRMKLMDLPIFFSCLIISLHP